ncbi:hypothetical protein H4V99_001108 [Cryobacterium sp. CG_9.6]|nr:hypothetical protein [Cryobacterium sp. CG_9.6]
MACTVFQPPARTPIIALLNMNFRMKTSAAQSTRPTHKL